MKKSAIYIVAIISLLLSAGCSKPLKDVNDYFPVIKTVSAVVQDDGSVTVTGEVESEGKAKDGMIKHVGFCMSTNNTPQMLERQFIAPLNGTSFSCTYPANLFKIDSVYYFRSWGSNHYGYSYGNSIRVDSIAAVAVTPPCKLTMNSVNIGGSQPTAYYDDVSGPDTDNTIIATSFNGTNATFKFGSILNTGIFYTTSDPFPTAGKVFVNFSYQSVSGALATGSKVYIKRLSAASFELSICQAPWSFNSSTLYFNTHLTTP